MATFQSNTDKNTTREDLNRGDMGRTDASQDRNRNPDPITGRRDHIQSVPASARRAVERPEQRPARPSGRSCQASGPLSAAQVGAVVGAMGGGLAGKGVAEHLDPTAEDAYWRENYKSRPYYSSNETYDEYAPAYRYGWESRSRNPERHFEDVESDMGRGWESAKANSRLGWEKAKSAARDAWDRVDHAATTDQRNSL